MYQLDALDKHVLEAAVTLATAQFDAAWKLADQQQTNPTADQVIAVAQILATNYAAQIAKNHS